MLFGWVHDNIGQNVGNLVFNSDAFVLGGGRRQIRPDLCIAKVKTRSWKISHFCEYCGQIVQTQIVFGAVWNQ